MHVYNTFFVAILTNPFQSVALPKLYGMFFEVLRGRSNDNNFQGVFENVFNTTAPGLMYLIIFVYILVTIMFTLKNIIEAHLIPKFLTFSRDHIFAQTMNRYSSDFKEIKVGEYITRVLEVTRYMKNVFAWAASDIIPEILSVFTTTLSFYFIDKQIFTILMFNVLVVSVLLYQAGHYIVDATSEREERYFELSQKISDVFSNLMNIYLNNQEQEEQRKTSNMNEAYGVEYAKQIYKERILINSCQFLTIFAYGLCFFKLYYHYTKKSLPQSLIITTVLLLGNYINYVFFSVGYIVNNFFAYWGQVKSSIPFLEDLFSKSKIRSISKGISNGEIQFSNVSFSYDKNKQNVLRNFSLHIRPRSKVAIIGPSGSGKTTLTKMLIGIHKPKNGKITIDGIDINELDTNYLRSKVIYVNQKTNLFDDTIIQNILYGNKDISQDEILKIMKQYNLFPVYEHLEKGIFENAGVNGSNLSLGMQKVTIILRAILKQGTSVYIFDEPLSGLDEYTRKKVIKLILDFTKNKSLLIITHDDEITPFMDKVINIENMNNK